MMDATYPGNRRPRPFASSTSSIPSARPTSPDFECEFTLVNLCDSSTLTTVPSTQVTLYKLLTAEVSSGVAGSLTFLIKSVVETSRISAGGLPEAMTVK